MLKLGNICNDNVLPRLRLRLRLLPLLYSTSTLTKTSSTNDTPCSLSEFLVNSLGFTKSQTTAVSDKLAKLRKWGTSDAVSTLNFIDNALSVVDFFKQLGLHHSQIKALVATQPRYLMSSVDNSFKPKVKLLKDLGVSDSDFARIVVANSHVLRIRLEPVIDAFRTVLGSDDDVVRCLKRQMYLGGFAYLVPNVQLLHNSFGVPMENIRKAVLRLPRAFLVRTDEFRQTAVKVEQKLGIPRDSSMFIYGLQLLICFDEKRLEDKFAVYKSFGWTQSQINVLMRGHPCCFNCSASMIEKKLDFLMNQVGYTPDYLMTRVPLFTYSVDKRLMPRYRILQILNEKGNGKGKHSLYNASFLAESVFVKRFVLPFEEVHQLYAQLTGSKVGSLNVGTTKGQS